MREECPIDPFDPAIRSEPYATYARLRRDHPVCWSRRGFWFAFRHDDVADLLKDDRYDHWDMGASSVPSRSPRDLAMKRCLELLSPDGAAHVRPQILRALSGQRLAELDRDLALSAVQLLTAFPRDVGFDVIADFAIPLTFRTTCARLGAPVGMLDALVATVRETEFLLNVLPIAEAHRAGDLLAALVVDIVDRRRGDRRDDLCSAIWNAVDFGDSISAAEIADLLVFLLYAGSHNTTNFIGLAACALLGQADPLLATGGPANLANHAIDELLRYDGPVQYIRVTARAPVSVRGQHIEPGEAVFACLGSANRDPEVFDEPDRLNLDRVPVGQIGFGRGPLQCIGAALARRQGAAALNALFAIRPDLRRIDGVGASVNVNSPVLRGLNRLLVE